jgi:hypothetical protein
LICKWISFFSLFFNQIILTHSLEFHSDETLSCSWDLAKTKILDNILVVATCQKCLLFSKNGISRFNRKSFPCTRDAKPFGV